MKKTIVTAICAAALTVSSLPAAGAVSATVTATPTRNLGQSVYVDNTRVYPTGYNINDNNYFKLRDVGKLAGFGVDWNEDTRTVEISTTRTAPELTGITDTAVTGATAKPTDQRITVDGKEVSMTAYKIKGNNYVKLRDIGKTINFGVSFNMATKAVSIDPNGTYVEEVKPTPSTPTAAAITKWNSTMDEFNEEMIQNHSDKDKLLAIAAKYGPTITGKANATTADVISALESMTGAPLDAISFDDKPVSLYWAKQLRKANGETVKEDTSVSDNQTSTDATVTDAMINGWKQEMIRLVNEERTKAGVQTLVADDNLMQWSQYWSERVTLDWRHSTWEEEAEYAQKMGIAHDVIAGGENLAQEYNHPSSEVAKVLVNSLMNSEGHKRTLLIPEYTRIGVGIAVGSDGTVYACHNYAE